MLDELHVENIALIEDASIEFAPGLTVLTGETGAGKTALLTALDLVRGKRAYAGSVRSGAAEACVEARFVAGGVEQVVRRRVLAQGRSRCSIDGRMASVGELAAAASFIRIHGQSEQGQLTQASTQLEYLDAFIDANAAHVQAYTAARKAYFSVQQAYNEQVAARERSARELEFMRYTIEQVEAVAPQEGECEALEEELPRLQHAEQLAAAVEGAVQALASDGTALDEVAHAQRMLERESGIDGQLDALAERLGAVEGELRECARDLRLYAESLSYDPQRLQQVLARLDALQGLARRFGPSMEEVFAAYNDAAAGVAATNASPEHEAQLAAELAAARAAYEEQAGALAAVRHEAAPRFCAELTREVSRLVMEGASFEFSFNELPFERWGRAGSEAVELLYRPAPASEQRPLAQIASGGELSRISLALECMYRAGRAGTEVTLVFDEIDQGVGGVTGAAVAEALAQLAQSAQVIVVTHLPQVAAYADAHYVVSKHNNPNGTVATSVAPVEGEARVAELARMLSGKQDALALEHAASLLADAHK